MVTVIIPTYKRANYLKRAIESVLNQTYKNYQLIVVDDNNPETKDRQSVNELMKNYIDRENVLYIQHDKNKNGAVARNTGIGQAKGEYLTFLDDDDYFLPERLEKVVYEMNRNSEYDAAYTGVIYTRNKRIVKRTYANKSGKFIRELLMQKSFFGTGSNLFFRTSSINHIKGFDESFIRHQDMELMIRFFENGKILGIKDFLVVKNDDDRINIPKISSYIETKEKFLDKFSYIINEYSLTDKNKIYYSNYLEILRYCVKNSDYINYKIMNKKICKYGKFGFIDRLKLLKIFIGNYINIEGVKDIVYNNFIIKDIDKSKLQYVKNLEINN